MSDYESDLDDSWLQDLEKEEEEYDIFYLLQLYIHSKRININYVNLNHNTVKIICRISTMNSKYGFSNKFSDT